MRVAVASLLSVALALAPLVGAGATMAGTIEGVVSVSGRPVRGVTVSMIEVATGELFTARSGDEGQFAARVSPGEYIVTAQTRGLGVQSGPSMLRVAAGASALARLDLVNPGAGIVGTTPAPQQGQPGEVEIIDDPFSCFVAGEGNSPIIDATFAPPDQVFTAQVLFSSGLEPGVFYSVDMVMEPPVPPSTVPTWKGILPWPTVEADPMTYYILVNGISETEHYPVTIIEPGGDCDGRIAPIAAFGAPALLGGGAALAPILIPSALVAGALVTNQVVTDNPPQPAGFTPPPSPPPEPPPPEPPPPEPPPPEPPPPDPPAPPAPEPEPEPEPPPDPVPIPTSPFRD